MWGLYMAAETTSESCRAVRLVVYAADKPAKADLLRKKNTIPSSVVRSWRHHVGVLWRHVVWGLWPQAASPPSEAVGLEVENGMALASGERKASTRHTAAGHFPSMFFFFSRIYTYNICTLYSDLQGMSVHT
jgi:hypothetical protein